MGWIINCLIVVNILHFVTSPILSCKFCFVSQNCIMFYFWPNFHLFNTSVTCNFKCLVNFYCSDVNLFASSVIFIYFFLKLFNLYKLNFKRMWTTHILHKLIWNVKLVNTCTINMNLKNPCYISQNVFTCISPILYSINYGLSSSNKIIVLLLVCK